MFLLRCANLTKINAIGVAWIWGKLLPLQSDSAAVVKLVYTIDLGSIAERHGGSSPPGRTIMSLYKRFDSPSVCFAGFLFIDCRIVASPPIAVSLFYFIAFCLLALYPAGQNRDSSQ